ncbi:MAG: phosphate-starvation-inducible PsiE family protein [Bacteroidales bacterium]|nr:phosphate-starvation-inducible PsiE family protein [Bacteroidales bacterium]
MKYLKSLETIIIWILVVMMSLVLIISLIQLGYTMFTYIVSQPFHIFDEKSMLGLLGSILIVLIGIELLDTIKVYLKDDVVHVEIVILVAIIALARKIIVMDFDKYPAMSLFALSAMLVALGIGYYLIKHSDCKYSIGTSSKKPNGDKDS